MFHNIFLDSPRGFGFTGRTPFLDTQAHLSMKKGSFRLFSVLNMTPLKCRGVSRKIIHLRSSKLEEVTLDFATDFI
jgi:hypothetical protein